MDVPTDAEIFHANNPLILLRDLPSTTLQEKYGFSTPRDVIENIWKRYGRIDLIKWAPEDVEFYDYRKGKYIPLSEINPSGMTTAAQLRLLNQMTPIIKSWPSNHPITQLASHLQNTLTKIAGLSEVIDPDPVI
jgi:hypothetical protein